MDSTKSESRHLKKIRILLQALVVSGSVNIALLCYLSYVVVRDVPSVPHFELKPKEQVRAQTDFTNGELLQQFREMSLEQLCAKLRNSQLADDGYTHRDIALGCLVSHYHFDLGKALLGHAPPSQQRKLVVGKGDGKATDAIIVFPGLTDDQWAAITRFATTERWPLTSHGLFAFLQKPEMRDDRSLVETFLLTPEFLCVETLFSRCDVPVTRREVVNVLLEGNWEMLSALASQQQQLQDLSPARRQRFLMGYVENGSVAAASMLLRTDRQFAIKKLDDAHIVAFLNLLKAATEDNKAFAQEILMSPRSNAVLQAAAARLYSYAGEAPPEQYQHITALSKFIPENILRQRLEVLAADTPLASKPPIAPPKPPAEIPPPKSAVAKVPAKPAAAPKATSAAKAKAPAKAADPKPIAAISPPGPKAEGAKKTVLTASPKIHLVQKGDTLWQISRRYSVPIEQIKKRNQLTSDYLKPGSLLIVSP